MILFLYLVFLLVFLCALQGQQIRSISPGQQWPGFSFALYLLRVQGFCFALLQYNPIQAFTARFASSMQLYRQRHKTAHKALQVFFLLFDPFNRSRYQTDTSGYNTACATPDAAQVSAAAYYNKVYRGGSGATYRRPCQPGGVSSYRLRIAGKCYTRSVY